MKTTMLLTLLLLLTGCTTPEAATDVATAIGAVAEGIQVERLTCETTTFRFTAPADYMREHRPEGYELTTYGTTVRPFLEIKACAEFILPDDLVIEDAYLADVFVSVSDSDGESALWLLASYSDSPELTDHLALLGWPIHLAEFGIHADPLGALPGVSATSINGSFRASWNQGPPATAATSMTPHTSSWLIGWEDPAEWTEHVRPQSMENYPGTGVLEIEAEFFGQMPEVPHGGLVYAVKDHGSMRKSE